MTNIDKQLREFLAAGTAGVFEASSSDVAVECEFSSIDSMACAINTLSVCFPAARSPDQLRKTCDALSVKLSYLLEPLDIIECDAELSSIQMRSNPPQVDERTRRYYELTATPNRLALCRFEKPLGQSRMPIESVFTHEVAMRLIEDLVGA